MPAKPPTITDKSILNEIWKDIHDYEGYYQVSNCGRIRSLNRCVNKISINTGLPEKKLLIGKIKVIQLSPNGYPLISLYKENVYSAYTVHRLVAKAFIQNLRGLPQINHIDGNPKNNHVSNLEWCTHSHNMLHSYRVLNRKPPKSAFVEGGNHIGAMPILVSVNGKIECVFSHSTEAVINMYLGKSIKAGRATICEYCREGKLYYGYKMEYISKELYEQLSIAYPAKKLSITDRRDVKRKLTDEQVFEIKRLLSEKYNCRQISEIFTQVSEGTISKIKLGKRLCYS